MSKYKVEKGIYRDGSLCFQLREDIGTGMWMVIAANDSKAVLDRAVAWLESEDVGTFN